MNCSKFMLRISLLALWMSVSTSVLAQDVKGPSLSVCSLLSRPGPSEGKQISVQGFLTATMEAMWLENTSCSKKLYLRYDSGKGFAEKDWEDAVNDQIGGIDRRPMHVVVQGVFRSHVRSGGRHIAQLTVTKIVSWNRKSSVDSEEPH